jgi:glyoxylase-like metal-dependent hydrolase (beta-lactamase superfamily II)
MNTKYHHFKIGEFKCVCLSDGSMDYPLQNFFNVPQEQIEAALRQYNLPTEHLTTPYTCLFVNTSRHQVMVDIGAGDLGPNTGRLLQNMQAAKIEPANIDTIIITHAHPDHVGGNLDNEGNLIYPNAHYFIWKEEWDFWISEDVTTKVPDKFVTCAHKNLKPVLDRMSFIEEETEIVPGISAIAAPGHTPGHMALSIVSNGEQLLHVSDTVLYPLHLEHPDWTPIYDILPEKANTSKRRIFDRAATEKALVFAHHFPPFPNLGQVIQHREGWQWQPIVNG